MKRAIVAIITAIIVWTTLVLPTWWPEMHVYKNGHFIKEVNPMYTWANWWMHISLLLIAIAALDRIYMLIYKVYDWLKTTSIRNRVNNAVQWCYKFCQRTWIIVLVMCMVGCGAAVDGMIVTDIGEIKDGQCIYTTTGPGANIIARCGLYQIGDMIQLTNGRNTVIHDTVYIPIPSESHSQIK